MKNRSQEYISKRNILYKHYSQKEMSEVEKLFSKIAEELSTLKILVDSVEKECLLYCIPTFASKGMISDRITSLRYKIALTLTRSKGIMEEFSTKYKRSINHSLVESIGTHFHFKLDHLISRMNKALEKIEESRDQLTERTTDKRLPNDKASVEEVYKSVFFITNIIRELKSVVLSQSDKIERLDTLMDTVTHGAEKTKKEITSISTFGSQIKNRIITILFLSIFVLIVLSTIKAYSQSSHYKYH
ncbi:hypothetical protein NEOKW01_2108 [Nematocida sp. AWRm80]|nr:hypothetical protein NEOKW01_2108 [Nematocida sp. AWRm80]